MFITAVECLAELMSQAGCGDTSGDLFGGAVVLVRELLFYGKVGAFGGQLQLSLPAQDCLCLSWAGW